MVSSILTVVGMPWEQLVKVGDKATVAPRTQRHSTEQRYFPLRCLSFRCVVDAQASLVGERTECV